MLARKMLHGDDLAKLSGQGGQAMAAALFVMTLVFLLGLAVLQASRSVQRNSASALRQKQAYYIAEAGVNQALALLADGWSDLGGITGEAYAGGMITAASCSGPVSGVYTVTCTARFPDPAEHFGVDAAYFSSCTLKAQCRLTPAAEPGGGLEPGAVASLRRGLWTGSLLVGGGARIESDICDGGRLRIAAGGSVGDNSRPVCVHASGGVVLDSGGCLYGDVASREGIDLSAGDSVCNNLTAMGGVALGPGNRVDGAVLAGGGVSVDGSEVNRLEAGQAAALDGGCRVRGAVRTAGGLALGEGVEVQGSAWTMGDLEMGEGSRIGGAAWVHGSCRPVYGAPGCTIAGGPPRFLGTLTLKSPAVAAVVVPPDPDLDYYRRQVEDDPERCFSEGQTFHPGGEQPWSGIYYVRGDLRLEADGLKYAGRATLAASGSIIIPDGQDLLPLDGNGDSLVLIAGDGIRVGSGSRVSAFLWSGGSIAMGASSSLKGALISPTTDFGAGPVFVEQVGLRDRVTLISWQ